MTIQFLEKCNNQFPLLAQGKWMWTAQVVELYLWNSARQELLLQKV